MIETLPLIYIAGPFRSSTPLGVRRNVEAARDVGLRIAHLGAYPIIPHMLTAEFDKQLTDDFWLVGTLTLLRKCDAILMMGTWESSTGARAEHADAKARGQPIFYDGLMNNASLRSWIEAWKTHKAAQAAIDEKLRDAGSVQRRLWGDLI